MIKSFYTALIIWCLVWASAVSAGPVQVSWQDNSNNEDGFKVERKIAAGSYVLIGTTAANAVSYIDSTASDTETNWYRIAAFNTAGLSTYSKETSILLLQIPAAPTNVSAAASALPLPPPPLPPSSSILTGVFNGITQ